MNPDDWIDHEEFAEQCKEFRKIIIKKGKAFHIRVHAGTFLSMLGELGRRQNDGGRSMRDVIVYFQQQLEKLENESKT